MHYPTHTSIENLMNVWLTRRNEKKDEATKLFKEGHPVESGICFGHQVAIGRCLEEIIVLLDYFQKQAHAVYEVLAASREKYQAGDRFQDYAQNDNNKPGKTGEEFQKSL